VDIKKNVVLTSNCPTPFDHPAAFSKVWPPPKQQQQQQQQRTNGSYGLSEATMSSCSAVADSQGRHSQQKQQHGARPTQEQRSQAAGWGNN
jgi:hypothetical protein